MQYIDLTPSWSFRKDCARGTICSIKNPRDDPITYSFKIGINQAFENERSFVLRDKGSKARIFSGPIATIADPTHF